jgi:hypothetical protein
VSGLNSLQGQIKNPRSKVFRRAYIKRRVRGTGLYEDNWQEVTKDVVKWGTIKKEVDASKVNSFKFSFVKMTFSNKLGRYNPAEDENSLWYGYGDQQRTLVRIQAGFVYEELGADGIWDRTELPGDAYWDTSLWDLHQWDDEGVLFSGFISGDLSLNGSDQVDIPVAPLTEAFRLFSAARLTGYSPSLTASGFIEMLRDQVDVNGAYIFRPFFGDTSTRWTINTTTSYYTNLDTQTAADVRDSTVWNIIEQLAAAENFVPYASNAGEFNFVARDYGNTDSSFHFYGAGGFSPQYGHTIKQVKKFYRSFSKYYSRVRIKFRDADTSTSYVVADSNYEVMGSSGPWTLGERTLDIENIWIPTSTVAETIAEQLFDEYSAIRTEVEFTTTLVPHLDLMQRVQITYDPTANSPQSIWDAYNWGDDLVPIQSDELLWDSSGGDAMKMNAREFRLISIEVNLDTLECKFIGRE